MKKAAIITLYGNSNYGNKLQNYAVQKTLEKYNIYPINIRNFPLLNNKKNKYINLIKFIKRYLKNRLLYSNDFLHGFSKEDTKDRKNNFLDFDKKLNNSKEIFNFWNYKKYKNFDYYIVGSDQVWNPQYGGLSDLDLLTFTKGKKISLSASFGINYLNEDYKDRLKKSLTDFEAISVRENEGKEIIDSLEINLDVEVLIDPTMYLDSKEWDDICEKPKFDIPKNYILLYFLGDISDDILTQINNYAKKNNYEIINILDKNSKYYSCGPSEFVYLEKNANFICTDSFHSSVFAIIYNIPFVVLDRKGKYNNMNSRIKTLLKKFKLESQLFDSKQGNFDSYLNINYDKTNDILKNEREKVKDFLNTNLNGE